MGIDNTAARMLLLLKATPGVSMRNALFYGHQKNYLGFFLRRKIAQEFRYDISNLNGKYADLFLEIIGASNFKVLDISDYEGASIIQDLNLPIPKSLENKFETVVDIGTTEHIFNINQSFENIRGLCKVGGKIMMLSPANSYLGHGFYQFSPELFFRAFDREFGFEINSMYLIKQRFFYDKWYEITDPRNLNRRGTIFTRDRCYLGVISTKVSDISLSEFPQQSDYVTAWNENKVSKLGKIYLSVPVALRKFLDLTIMSILGRYRNRLKRATFEWVNGDFRMRHD